MPWWICLPKWRRGRCLLQPGDVVISNDPFHGGTHLPDITAITPVFVGAGAPRFFVASRGHHADVGGLTPDHAALQRTYRAGGLRLRHWPLVRAGRRSPVLGPAAGAGAHSAAGAGALAADLQAQVAANRLGVELLEALVVRDGQGEGRRYMQHVQDHAAAAVEALLPGLEDRSFAVVLDNGARAPAGSTGGSGQPTSASRFQR